MNCFDDPCVQCCDVMGLISQAWIASAVKTSIEMDQSIIRDFKPLTALGVKKVLFVGLIYQLLLGLKLLHNEHDFPETYLFDVWRLCSLQRKLRIDASALCVIPGLRRWLNSVNLLETDNGRLALERVTKLFLSVDYGMRVSLFCFWFERIHS
jgi:hypothetical protein